MIKVYTGYVQYSLAICDISSTTFAQGLPPGDRTQKSPASQEDVAFGAMMLGFAIAFGIGGQDLARCFLERKFTRTRKEENDDELSPP